MTDPAALQNAEVAMSTKDALAAMRADEEKRMAAVPKELVDQLGERMYDDAHEGCGCDGDGCHGTPITYYEKYARVLLADVLPEHERLVREQVAKETGTAARNDSAGQDRGDVPAGLRSWSVPYPAYRPIDITPPELRPGAGLEASIAEGWAEPCTDPTRLPDLAERRAAALTPYNLDADGRPRHPGGRTGKIGRNLGRWGENTAADPIVVAGTGPNRKVLLIRREDCGQWAIPGGHVEVGEAAPAALVRELAEETGVDLSGLTPHILTRTLVADPRETDWAWIATTVALFQIPTQITPTAGDDATDARWFAFGDLSALTEALAEFGGVLYEAHRPLLNLALAELDDLLG